MFRAVWIGLCLLLCIEFEYSVTSCARKLLKNLMDCIGVHCGPKGK